MKFKLHDKRLEYVCEELNEKILDTSPHDQFKKWYEEVDSVELPSSFESNAFTLSTVDLNGQPHSRIVLLKQFSSEGFVFFTNYESKKGADLSSNNKACMLFWWPSHFRQVRIEGEVSRISEKDCKMC